MQPLVSHLLPCLELNHLGCLRCSAALLAAAQPQSLSPLQCSPLGCHSDSAAPLVARAAAQPLTNTEKHRLERRIKTLEAVDKNSWIVWGSCFIHGHGVAVGHGCKTCGTKGVSHVDTAARRNPAGLGKEKNKGWDAWLS